MGRPECREDKADLVRGIGEQANIFFVRQKEQLGLGDAVRHGRRFVGDEPFALLLGDTIIDPGPGTGVHGLEELLRVYTEHGKSVVAVRRVPDNLVSHYGIVDGDFVDSGPGELYALNRLVEKPAPEAAPSDLAIAGRYIFTPEIFDCIEGIEAAADGEIQLTDAMNLLAAKGGVLALAWEAQRYDIGNKADYVRCFIEFARRHPETRDAVEEYLAGPR